MSVMVGIFSHRSCACETGSEFNGAVKVAISCSSEVPFGSELYAHFRFIVNLREGKVESASRAGPSPTKFKFWSQVRPAPSFARR